MRRGQMRQRSQYLLLVGILFFLGCQNKVDQSVSPPTTNDGEATADRVMQHLLAFETDLKAGNYLACEQDLYKAIQTDPSDQRGHRYLAQLLNAQGRRFESHEHIIALEMLGGMDHAEALSLIDLGGPFRLADFDPFIKKSSLSLFDLGQARILYDRGKKHQEVLAQLVLLADAFPESAAIAAFHGRLLADAGDHEQMVTWLANVPNDVEGHPEYWFCIGSWLRQQQRDREAARAFGEAIRLDPTDRRSLSSLAAILDRLGKPDQARHVQQTAGTLDKILRLSIIANAEQSIWIADQLQKLVRPWESLAWYRHAVEIQGAIPQFANEFQRRREKIQKWQNQGSQDQLRDVRLKTTLGFDIEAFPLPDLNLRPTLATNNDAKGSMSPLRFNDVAESAGILTTFISDYPENGDDLYLHQANGGGIAVIDFDLDGRCDLYFAQSGGDPQTPNGSSPNQLYRQLPDQQFVDVSLNSQTADRGFSQGVCSADVDQDGFPDLLVANIGRDSLYINQGDGTFREQSDWINDRSDSWTSSIAVGDINGDRLPDLVEVNYLDDPNIFQRPCRGKQHDCTPQRFRAAKNRYLVGVGDGRLMPWDQIPDSSITPSYGMGVVIANFDRQAGNDVFISNDGDLNYFWKSKKDNGNGFALTECASIIGCSVGRSGYSQASMGIASGDFDRNGLLDLLVTNFYDEPVNLYLQNSSQFFVDEALNRNLATPSLKVLGFGTQAADFDNDGWQDAAVLNGHLYNATYAGVPYRMLAQLFRGQSTGFSMQNASDTGKYWQREQLGRTLALLDFNQDGRMDLVANHLDQPIAILQNDSESKNWIQLELVGTDSERAAVGASIVVFADDQSWTAWRTSGDGYMCTNEPIIHVGVGEVSSIERIEIHWPAGSLQTIRDLKTNKRYLAIEGESSVLAR
jgi:tetratricopeptide (TPR) repeat protein